jgi:Arc/MetJ-type ribon-helix-helix transcriptional regulator
MTAQPGHKVTLKLNQQQIELIERTIARGAAPDIESLVRRALRDYAARHPTEPGTSNG